MRRKLLAEEEEEEGGNMTGMANETANATEAAAPNVTGMSKEYNDGDDDDEGWKKKGSKKNKGGWSGWGRR